MIISHYRNAKKEIDINYENNTQLYNIYLVFPLIVEIILLFTRVRACQRVNVFRFNAIDAWW